MARVGLVLGAGGAVGGAFHAGVLAALVEGTGWDPNEADVIVGTSAGSVSGAILRAGLPATDMTRRLTGQPLSAEGAALLRRYRMPTSAPFTPLRPVDGGAQRRSRPSSPRLLRQAARRPWTARPAALFAAAMPAGVVPTDIISQGVGAMFPAAWPSRSLWICSVLLGDGRRVVFGRVGAPRASVGEAVAASCAIPGWFKPVDIDGVEHIDGGVHSLCNLDLVAGLDLDLVLVSAPMSAAGRRPPINVDAPMRVAARAQLGREALRLRRHGIPVIAFQPTAQDLQAMGSNAMDPARRAPVAVQARTSTLRRLERADLQERLGILHR